MGTVTTVTYYYVTVVTVPISVVEKAIGSMYVSMVSSR